MQARNQGIFHILNKELFNLEPLSNPQKNSLSGELRQPGEAGVQLAGPF